MVTMYIWWLSHTTYRQKWHPLCTRQRVLPLGNHQLTLQQPLLSADDAACSCKNWSKVSYRTWLSPIISTLYNYCSWESYMYILYHVTQLHCVCANGTLLLSAANKQYTYYTYTCRNTCNMPKSIFRTTTSFVMILNTSCHWYDETFLGYGGYCTHAGIWSHKRKGHQLIFALQLLKYNQYHSLKVLHQSKWSLRKAGRRCSTWAC